MSKAQELYAHAKQHIPGGTQLLSKKPEMFVPGRWPTYATKAKGCEVWDLDGKHYYDMTNNGIGACLLGYADPDVTAAVVSRVENGSMTTLNAPEEVYLADRLIEIHPWAEQVRFARTGGEICAMAVRIARATTGRDIVFICGYHGWADWYLAANLGNNSHLDGQLMPGLEPCGVPRSLHSTAFTFNYGDTEEFDRLIAQYGDRLSCVIMEPARSTMPAPGFLKHIKEETNKVGGLLIFDEITIGWRLAFGGGHRIMEVNPDIAVFAKAMGNGHPIAAVIGTTAAMEGVHTSFISSTYWTEAVGPTAALATIHKMEKTRVWEHAAAVGKRLQAYWTSAGSRYGIPVHASGLPCLSHFDFEENPKENTTLYITMMLEEGFLGNTAIYPTLAHTDEILIAYESAIDRVFEKMAQINRGGVDAIIDATGGVVKRNGFKRLVN